MDEFVRITMLYDIYAGLLTDRQREFMSMYYGEDLSLAETAELRGVTPQAVRDVLRRVVRQLERYEDKLRLLEAHERRKETACSAWLFAEKLGGVSEEDRRKLSEIISGLAE